MKEEKTRHGRSWAKEHGGLIIGAGAWIVIGLLTLTMAFCGPG